MKLPIAFQEKYQALLGDDYSNFIASFQIPHTSGFRLNPLKQDFKKVNQALDKPISYCSFGYYGKIDGKSIDHTTGYLYSQEPSAMFVGAVVDAQPGEVILDLCAAPGGKSTYLASTMAQSGLLISNEINLKRSKVLAENLRRFGVVNNIVTNCAPNQLEKALPQFFDKIIVDAPCSGEGMFRKDEKARDFWHANYPLECAKRQRHILSSAYEMLKDGGELIYSTCTFSPEENEQNIAWLLQHYSDLTLLPIVKSQGMADGRPDWADHNPELKKTVRLWPHLINGEGHFVAKLYKSNPQKSLQKNPLTQLPAITPEIRQLWQDFKQETFKRDIFEHLGLTVRQDKLIGQTKINLNLKNIHIIQSGLFLGWLKKNRIEPSYDSILALSPDDLKKVIDLNDSDYQKYCHGETLQVTSDHKGWIGLTYQGKLFSWGKLVNGTVKNFYPKRLRH